MANPSNSHSTAVISSEAAAIALKASTEHAQKLGIAINVAITDSSGVLAGFLRMPGAFLHSIDIAIDKAYTSASFGFPTSQWLKILEGDPALKAGLPLRPRLVIFGGGTRNRTRVQFLNKSPSVRTQSLF